MHLLSWVFLWASCETILSLKKIMNSNSTIHFKGREPTQLSFRLEKFEHSSYSKR